jgi:hypothetical protein
MGQDDAGQRGQRADGGADMFNGRAAIGGHDLVLSRGDGDDQVAAALGGEGDRGLAIDGHLPTGEVQEVEAGIKGDGAGEARTT